MWQPKNKRANKYYERHGRSRDISDHSFPCESKKTFQKEFNLAHHSSPKDRNHLLTSSPQTFKYHEGLYSFSSNNTYQAWLNVNVLGVFHLVVVPGTRYFFFSTYLAAVSVNLSRVENETSTDRMPPIDHSFRRFKPAIFGTKQTHKPTLCFNDEVQTFTMGLADGTPSPRCHSLFVLCCIQMTSQDFLGPCYCNDPTHIDVVLNCSGKGRSTVE